MSVAVSLSLSDSSASSFMCVCVCVSGYTHGDDGKHVGRFDVTQNVYASNVI